MYSHVRTIIFLASIGILFFARPLVARAQTGTAVDELLAVPTFEEHTPLPVQETNPPKGTTNPTFIDQLASCTASQNEQEFFTYSLETALQTKQLDEQASRELARVTKAREDVNKLIASTYNELRTQQIANQFDATGVPDFTNVLQTIGIAVVDDTTGSAPDVDAKKAICQAGNSILARVSENNDNPQCVAITQESRVITNQDDYIYEEGRRKAMDALFCYLGDWRHFPLADFTDTRNCEALGLSGDDCNTQKVWQTLGQKVHNSEGFYHDVDGTDTKDNPHDDQNVYTFCEGMRVLGKKCAQDYERDVIKYKTIDNITRKTRTIALAPPQTWYTPGRCAVINNFLPGTNKNKTSGEATQGTPSPYTQNIKSLHLVNTNKFTSSFEWINYYFGSPFGNPTVFKTSNDMNPGESTLISNYEPSTGDENSFPRLMIKAGDIAQSIIDQTTELRKLQYTSGEGIRDATLRIGWRDYNWKQTTTLGDDPFLEKYDALDYYVREPAKPNKILKPLPCYWNAEQPPEKTEGNLCDSAVGKPDGLDASGATFYFDTDIVLSPVLFIKDKLRSAIQAQFDLARDTFAIRSNKNAVPITNTSAGKGTCTTGAVINWLAPSTNALPAPWEDPNINLAQSINPLTGKNYTQESLIPQITGNYFNAVYNDVFQLYHTPFPLILEQWFANADPEPTYDSVYLNITKELINVEDLGADGGGDPNAPDRFAGTPATGPLPVGCQNYKDVFKSVGDKEGVDPCLLEGIAATESSCNPQAESPAHACGITQFKPATATIVAGKTITCDYLKQNPEFAIGLSAQYLKGAQAKVASYGFKDNSQDENLIASYNAGTSQSCSAPGSTNPAIKVKKAFCPSTNCPGKPAWQCPGAYKETQNYVPRVQNFRGQCNI